MSSERVILYLVVAWLGWFVWVTATGMLLERLWPERRQADYRWPPDWLKGLLALVPTAATVGALHVALGFIA